MSHDPITCRACGESYDPGGSEHDCPGTLREQMERIDELERDMHNLEHENAVLRRAVHAIGQRIGLSSQAISLILEEP